ncbi:hypothetical protein HYPSUDRAFT_202594 [Hypholoma sublateritium FD-334 SS-4]|uniref:Uncharacterized protein n=1 Tax=Hypholoma sublateritium (strain FD-334 SS-4) TaxID=945553 RepID=A0A0D2NSP5_HYPSF|nr:hypothetical protein HYPSUDRAFT_202594 [Hypholoma sublateritium FD-334 SS-4]
MECICEEHNTVTSSPSNTRPPMWGRDASARLSQTNGSVSTLRHQYLRMHSTTDHSPTATTQRQRSSYMQQTRPRRPVTETPMQIQVDEADISGARSARRAAPREFFGRCAGRAAPVTLTNPPQLLVCLSVIVDNARVSPPYTYVLDDSADPWPGSVDPGKSSAELTALCMPTQQAPAVRFAVVCLVERTLALVETR